jgi:dipeptidyl aminopeptidase/acylaminoacyl peptidase
MIRLSLFVLVFVLASTPSFGSSDAPVLMPEDYLHQVTVGTPEVSPDGKWIVYSVSQYCPKEERSEGDLFLRPLTGGDARRLTAGAGVESGYGWSPYSTKIVFSAKRDTKKSQIYVININGGEACRITDIEGGASSPLWSPDGARIAFASSVGELYTDEEKEAFGDVRYVKHPRFYHLGPGWDDGTRRRVFVVPAEGGEAKQLTDGECADEGDRSMAWSPDGKKIAYVSNRAKEWWNTIDTNIYVIDVETGENTQFTTNIGPDHGPAFSPDGKWLAYRSSYEYNYESENYKIHIQPINDEESTALTRSLDRNVRSFAWGPQSQRIYFTSSSHGGRNLRYVEIDKPDLFHDVTTGTNQISSFRVVDDERFVLYASTDVSPTEIYSLEGEEKVQLTDEATRFWMDIETRPSQEIWLDTADGDRIQGWLITPVGYEKGNKVPLVLNIHGGPHGMYSPSFRFDYQLLAHHGYAVLYTNPRGSDGYGQAFADAIHEDWHTLPFADVMQFVDHVVKQGIADPKKLGVTGGSYGGYLTNWVIGHTNRFAAAVSSAGLSNMVSFFGTTDEQFFAEKEMAGLPWQKKEVYLDNSPLWAADDFSTPTMVLHGDNDWRVRPEQGVQLFHALQKVGVPSVYVNFPDEQHGVRQPDHRILRYRLTLEWFDHWLQGKPVKLATYNKPKAYVFPPRP